MRNIDIRKFPCLDIWYCSKESRYFPGKLTAIYGEGRADLLVFTNQFGAAWELGETSYGKEKPGCWYFHNPADPTAELMAELGIVFTDNDKATHWEKEKQPEVEFVQEAVQNALAATKASSNNGNHNTSTRPSDTSSTKRKSA